MKRHTTTKALFAASLYVLMVLSGCRDSRAKYVMTRGLAAGAGGANELSVKTEVGSITVTGADVVDCNIVAEITVKAETQERARQLAEQVKIEARLSGEKLTVGVSKPEDLKKRSLGVTFEIVAPRRLRLDCSTNVGSVNVSDMSDRIRVSGNVLSVSCHKVVGDIDITSNVGSVEVEYEDAAPAAPNINITTNVGSIELLAPSQLSAQVSASTNVGSVETDKPIAVVGKVGKSINGTIGAGDGRIRLETNVGSIMIK